MSSFLGLWAIQFSLVELYVYTTNLVQQMVTQGVGILLSSANLRSYSP